MTAQGNSCGIILQKKASGSISIIEKINKVIKTVAENTNSVYLPAPEEFAADDGFMPDDAASDGVHFGKKYSLIWLEYLAKTMEGQQ